ncbi:MAG: hypothetical protein DHS20C16_35090 [Phycisphaerae bacterium]|nr:MAG: hypothetical protein DHS20C16_35090 [Phycisphaerae bacterium]
MARDSQQKREKQSQSEEREDSTSVRRLTFVALLVALCLIVALVHWPVLSAQALSLDDGEFLLDNPLVQNPGWESAKRFLGEVLEPTTVEGYYLPLSMISLMTDYAMGGREGDLLAFHRTSLILHVLNVALIAIFLRMLFGNSMAAILAALVFGLHPLTVEPVAWIGERKTLLAMFFALLTMLSYLRFTHGRRWPWLAAACVAYVLALMSKPTVVPLPFLLVALDYWPLNRPIRKSLLEKLPLFLLAGLFAVVTLVSHSRTAGILSSVDHGPLEKLLLMCHLAAFYGGKIIFPTNLSSVYPVPAPISFANSTILVGVFVTILLGAAIVVSSKKTRAIVGGGIFFVLALAPTLGIVRYSWIYASDKYVYFPAIGLLMVLAWGLKSLLQKGNIAKIILGLVMLGVVGAEVVGVRGYLPKWDDTLTLSEHILSQAPGTPQIHVNLGDAYEDAGRREDAITQYRAAIQNWPTYALAHNNLGSVLAMEGDMENAIKHLRTALKFKPDDAPAHSNIAIALLDSGHGDEALKHCKRALELKPGYPKFLFVMGNILRARGDLEGAIASYREATKAKNDYVEAWRRLANVLLMSGRSAEAVVAYQRWIELDPANSVAHHNLAMALRAQGDHRAAVVQLREAIKLDPQYADAFNNLGVSLAALGQVEPAIDHFKTAVGIDPKYGEAYHNLGLVLQRIGRFGEAARNYRMAMELESGDSQAHFTLGVVLALDHRANEAVAEFKKALDLDPENPAVLNGIAWIYATSPDSAVRNPVEARTLATQAAERTDFRQPEVLDTLAAAYAANGEYVDAVMTIRKAIELVSASPRGGIGLAMKKRLELYEQGKPFIEEPN